LKVKWRFRKGAFQAPDYETNKLIWVCQGHLFSKVPFIIWSVEIYKAISKALSLGILASHSSAKVYNFLLTGQYDRWRKIKKRLENSFDILIFLLCDINLQQLY
jgi:hypothetical protein